MKDDFGLDFSFGKFVIFPPKISIKKGESYPHIPMENIIPGHKHVTYYSSKFYNGSGTKFKSDDILFARITPCLENGKIAQAKGLDNSFGFGSTEYFVFRGRKGVSDTNFVYYYSLTDWFRQNAINSMVGASGRQRADAKFISRSVFKFPHLSIQKKIANILSTYDDLIENNLKRITLLEEMAQITYEEWFVRLCFSGHEASSIDLETELPEGWKKSILSKAIAVNPKTSVPKGEMLPYIPMQSVNENSMAIWPIESRIPSGGTKFQDGDILVARITPCLENGKIGFVRLPIDQEKATGSTEYIVLRETSLVSRYYIYCLARSDYFRGNSIVSMAGSDGRQRVNPTIYNKLSICLPTPDIMEKFDNIVRPLFDQIGNLIQQNQFLIEARDILLPRFMTGMIDVEQYNPAALIKEVA